MGVGNINKWRNENGEYYMCPILYEFDGGNIIYYIDGFTYTHMSWIINGHIKIKPPFTSYFWNTFDVEEDTWSKA